MKYDTIEALAVAIVAFNANKENVIKILKTKNNWKNQNNTYDFFKDACDVALSYYLQQPDINVKVVRALGLIITSSTFT